MPAPDGTIVIDTKMITKGLSDGVKRLQSVALDGLNTVLLQTAKITEKVGGFVSGALNVVSKLGSFLKKVLLGAFIVLALSLHKIFASIRESIADVIQLSGPATVRQVEEIKNSFTELKAAIGAAFLPLVIFAIPYIKMAIAWLIEMFNRAAMITAAFLGQAEALQIVQGSAQAIADANKKTEKAARGQLAAFDQINVLQQQEDTPTSDLPAVAGQMVPITNEILEKVQAIKDEIAAWWADPIGKLKETWGHLVEWFRQAIVDPIARWWQETWRGMIEWFMTNVLMPLSEWWQETWLGKMIGRLWDNFTGTWKKIIDNSILSFQNIRKNILLWFEGIKQFLTGVFTGDWQLAWEGLQNIAKGIIGVLVEFVKTSFQNILLFATGWVNVVKIVWASIAPWFSANVTQPLVNTFGTALSWIAGTFTSVFTSIQGFVQRTINNIINSIGEMVTNVINQISRVLSSLQSITGFNIANIPSYDFSNTPIATYGSLGTTGAGFKPPRLATGAVIPPNAEFLAMLGDQKGGKNIEAPESLIRRIVSEEIGNIQADISITFDGSLGQLVRELKPHIDRENLRVGKSLVKSTK